MYTMTFYLKCNFNLKKLTFVGYYFGLAFASERLDLLDPVRYGQFASIALLVGFSSALCGILIARFWSWHNWRHHPICKVELLDLKDNLSDVGIILIALIVIQSWKLREEFC